MKRVLLWVAAYGFWIAAAGLGVAAAALYFGGNTLSGLSLAGLAILWMVIALARQRKRKEE